MPDIHKKRIFLALIGAGIVIGAICLWVGGGISLKGTAPQLSLALIVVGSLSLLATLAMVALLFFCGNDPQAVADGAGASGTADDWQKKTLMALIVLGVLVVGGTFVWAGVGIDLKDAGPELTLPLVVIMGVVVLLVTLALVAVTFSVLNMSDKSQALALPEGSVRAVIALMLLLVFAIAAIFLYSNVANSGKVRIAEKMTTANIIDLRKHVSIILTIPPFVEPPTTGGGTTGSGNVGGGGAGSPGGGNAGGPGGGGGAGVPGGGGPGAGAAPTTSGPLYTVYFRDLNSPAGDDIAKQLIVLLGTLVTAVASFYFGSSSVSSARDAADRAARSTAGPNATGVNPPSLNADGSSQTLTISGVNLQNVTTVKLVSGDGKTTVAVDPGSVKASAASVTCNIIVPKTAVAGTYDVVVTDNMNNSSPIRISIAGQAAPPASAAKPTGVEPGSYKVGPGAQTLIINGTGLDGVGKIELRSTDNKSSIPVTVVTPGAAKITGNFMAATAASAGTYEVVVFDKANAPLVVPNVKITIDT